jgi:ketosteroid isomerase-like protein
MRTFLMAGLLTLFAMTAAAAASPQEQQILDAEKAWASAVMAKDFAKLDTMLAPELIYAHSTGVIDDKKQYIGKMRSGSQNYKGIEQESIKVNLYGDSAVAHSHVRMHGTNAAGPFNDRLMAMHFWVKKNGKWLLVAHQTTKLP